MDITEIISCITQVVTYGAGIAFILALSEWIVKFFLDIAFDRFKSRLN